MKDFVILICLLIFFPIIICAQAPEAINYQCVVRDDNGLIIKDQMVGIQIVILRNNIPEYEETHNASTNSYGLINIAIGTGDLVSGEFNSIDWGNGSYSIQVGLDPTGGNNYNSIIGVSPLLSVPYALYAKNAGKPRIPDNPLNSISCINGLAINLLEVNPPQDVDQDGDTDNGAAIVYATDFLTRPVEDNVSYSINRVGEPFNADKKQLILTCDEDATLIVEVWKNDLNGNPITFCETYILVQDNDINCI